MRQQEKHMTGLRQASVVPNATYKGIDDTSLLTSGERRIIRNYRAMEQVAQQTFEDISEDFARSLPAPGRQGLAVALSRG